MSKIDEYYLDNSVIVSKSNSSSLKNPCNLLKFEDIVVIKYPDILDKLTVYDDIRPINRLHK
ncbi:hypothetical protein [Francisella orientalis]|uniref:Uncharacterized protein n=1 Tax=Francisella orientalis TaxID=299583 RepID=A0AAP7C5X9_9GAMM|nr:hypothetical protein [Francisella orientalis]AHB99107.1 hypothetical protein M973_03145 [Francisella orientalis LADL 07-285A]AKN85260.1 hypothetical protein FNO12_0526 [Francisella orientalis FNO12]AKN86799.1 Hypothetical protein FNO24_0526 [Francisella orientalis FNO24]AKN88338.1 Hypothetical protein FNO190_0526 [Francisella orientalis]AKU05092.1 Hypothetical protein FNO01_0526 [Francisella orientalis]